MKCRVIANSDRMFCSTINEMPLCNEQLTYGACSKLCLTNCSEVLLAAHSIIL